MPQPHLAQFQHPRLQIPLPLTMSPGSFAHYTLTRRWPAIAQRLVAENTFPSRTVTNLDILVQDLSDSVLRPLKDDHGPDLAAWAVELEPFLNRPWQDVPWYFAETYFYRRILEATQYFQPGPWQGIDPFASQKQASLEAAIDDLRAVNEGQREAGRQEEASLIPLVYRALWGNRADLSLQPTATPAQSSLAETQSHILVDDTPTLLERLARQQGRIDLIADNVGSELVCDLYLADLLLTLKVASTVYLHLKAHPTFVSDATILDVNQTLAVLAAEHYADIQSLAERLKHYLASGQLRLEENLFWTAPLVFWQMPLSLQTELAQSDFIFIKGDANYRRLLGDRHWPFTTSFRDIVCYFPTAFVALRTLKSELIAGLQPAQVEGLNRQDPEWLTNGQWGVIQVA